MYSAISRGFGISIKKSVSTRQTLVSSLYQTNVQYTNMGLPRDKPSLGSKKKLLVLCLGGLLVHRVHVKDKASVRGLQPDVVYDKFLVFKRPFCNDFLKFCFERFQVGLWSSARDHNIHAVLDNITDGARSKLLFVWSQKECTASGFYCIYRPEKPLFLKNLKNLWEKKYITKGQYSSSNTLLIDHEPHTCLRNRPSTAIFPDPYKKHDTKDAVLGPDGELRRFLDGFVDADDVPSYVKDHPIGQPRLSLAHPDWKYYAKIVDNFGKRGSSASADAGSSDDG